MKTLARTFGLYQFLTAVILFALSLIGTHQGDYSSSEILGYTAILLSLWGIFPGLKNYRSAHNQTLGFAQGLGIGLFLTSFSALGISLVDYLYTSVVNPDFFSEFLTRSLAEMKATMTAEEFRIQSQEFKSQMEVFSSSGAMAGFMFVTVSLMGLVVSLVATLIYKK